MQGLREYLSFHDWLILLNTMSLSFHPCCSMWQGFFLFLSLHNLSIYIYIHTHRVGLPWCFSGKESTCNAGGAGDMNSIPGLGRSSGGGHGNPLQSPCLENSMDREPSGLQPISSQSWPQLKRLSTHTYSTFSLSICLSMDIWIAATSWLL